MVARSYRLLDAWKKVLLKGDLICLEMRLKFPIFRIFQAVRLGKCLWSNTIIVCEKSCKIRGLEWLLSSTTQKYFKLGQCLMDSMTSASKFGEVTWPSLDFMDRSLFYRPSVFVIITDFSVKLAVDYRGQKSLQAFWLDLPNYNKYWNKVCSKNLVFKMIFGHFCESGLFWSKNLKICILHPIWCLNFVHRHLQWLSMAINGWNWYASICFDLFRVYSDLQDKKLVKNMPKIQILSTWITVYPKAAKRSIPCAPLLSLNGSTHRSSRTPC